MKNFIADFSGSQRDILEYLMEEVLAHQPVAVQDFLLRTSILERFCAELCEEVLGERGKVGGGTDSPSPLAPNPLSDSQQMLEYLLRANLFLIPPDDQNTWFCYHHLFANLLQARLRQTRRG